jgi:uncharacterized membrane protein YeaQ/YmgE (transglycosylase-associated protein family)
MDMMSLLISLISGAVGGNVAGAAMQDKSLGTLGNSLAGIFGGGIGSFILQALGVLATSGASGVGLGSILGNIASGGTGGAVLLVIVSLLKSAMAKTA